MNYFPDEHGNTTGDLKIIGSISSITGLEEVKVLEDVSLTYCRENTTVEPLMDDYDFVYVQFFPKSNDNVLEEKYSGRDFN